MAAMFVIPCLRMFPVGAPTKFPKKIKFVRLFLDLNRAQLFKAIQKEIL